MGADRRYLSGEQLESFVARALAGDEAGWAGLVEGLQRVVWKAVNMTTSDPEVRADAFAATWLRLAERLASIREPAKLPGWLATTAANEVRQIVRQRGHDHVPMSTMTSGEDGTPDLFATLIGDAGERDVEIAAAERRREVRDAFGRLDEGCREVITVLVLADPPVPYDEASEMLGRPIGSLGPTRGRCLDKLKNLLDSERETGTHS